MWKWFVYYRTMREGPDIANVAALIGYPARAIMLSALIDGRALTASELATLAGVTKQTASAHLSKLQNGGLISCINQGRHKYFSLKGSDVAGALEALMGVSATRSRSRIHTGPKESALRKARCCYDHLAGTLGVLMYDQMLAKKWLLKQGDEVRFTTQGKDALTTFGIDLKDLITRRRILIKPCLDWSIRRHHLRGSAAAAMLEQIITNGWANRQANSRAIIFSTAGERNFRAWLE